jgi:hypothetical protein
MPTRTSPTGTELFIVDNSNEDWKVVRYLRDWCPIAKSLDVATGYFEIGSLLALDGEWQKLDKVRILMGHEVSMRTQNAFQAGLARLETALDASLEQEKQKNDFLTGVPAIVEAIRSKKIECRVYRKDKFHAKAYITHARLEVVGASALVGSSNFTHPGLTENIELNVQITGSPVKVLQEWYEEHWARGEDVTPDILRVIERHTREYSPFEVYAKSLDELLRGEPLSADAWELAGPREGSRIFPVLDKYQQDGYHQLLKIAGKHRGALLCDGVGLGKTFVGLMLIERLIKYERKNVCLLVPKSGKEPVWESTISRYLPDLSGAFGSRLRIISHTDITRDANREIDYPRLMEDIKREADVFLIDEAHNFRNTGTGAPPETGAAPVHAIPSKGDTNPSRYWKLFDLLTGKQVFLLTATPVNNRLTDLQHLIELFTHRQADYFAAAPLGIHSLPAHFREMERKLLGKGNKDQVPLPFPTDSAEAAKMLSEDALFHTLVVQRSRSYVRKSQLQENGSAAMFPVREPPIVQDYSLKGTYGKVLDLLEAAFNHTTPLFTLPFYYPLNYYDGPDTENLKWEEGRQAQVVTLIRTQFLKRFESSAHAFENSCQRLMLKILTWITKHSDSDREIHHLEKWRRDHEELLGYVHNHQHSLFADEEAEDDADDIITEEMLDSVEKLSRRQYRVGEMFSECFRDLNQIAQFLEHLKKFTPKHDHKLQSLIKLLKTDPIMSRHKVLIFTEFKDTARYLFKNLTEAGITGVDEVDSGSDRDRGDILRQFAPYYNGTTSAKLAAAGHSETRILIATDVLSEGLNLQDATRLINYDIHWNPVRLMQRIGRVDRRMNPDTEAAIIADHPDRAPLRGKVSHYNFLPPDELNDLLHLYQKVAHKTLAISRTFGIEGKKLYKPDDDYQALKDFNAEYEGHTTASEDMRLEYERLLKEHPDLEARLRAMPGKIFSGKAHPALGTKAVFFCFALPALDADASKVAGKPEWSTAAGDAQWYLYSLVDGKISESIASILPLIRSTPETPRLCTTPKETLADIRAKVEKHIKNTYLKSTQAPVGVKPALRAWMELN